MISEKGSLKDTPIIKLLLTIFEQGLSGILYVKHADVLKVLYFSKGKLIWAISNSGEDKLENILVSESLVDPAVIQKIKKESHVSESVGKLLVEKGLITLEELVDSSREQLKRIIIDALKWADGGFQFVKEAPPERLLSLDLAVTDFIIDYIVEEMNIKEILNAIGSLQVELIKNPDKEKLSKYHLSDRQVELLDSFDGGKKLESILSSYSGGHRESLLKIIYFFLMAGLLIKKGTASPTDKESFMAVDGDQPGERVFPAAFLQDINKKEVELPDLPDFESDNDLDDAAAVPAVPDVPDVEIEEIPVETAKKTEDIERDTGSFEVGKDVEMELYQEVAASADLFSHSSAGDEEPGAVRPPGEKKRIKLFNVIFILIFLILIISGVILLLLPLLESDTPIEEMVKKKDAGDIIKIEEAKPAPSMAAGGKEKGDEDKETIPPTGKPAPSYFREGNLITAGDVWKKELKKTGVKYSILLELDCLKESVMNAYSRLAKKKDFFILNRKSGSRNCFLVMWGKFYTRKDAEEATKLIPNYFWQQKNPPQILELSGYL
ncbi:MAG: DUF4388 domain-containing protein [Candidatus Aminicenantes bacterium]|nr:DUF4388 domain-containing protein [Candidatus Aminicenantes bacterium]NIM83921.1 DUF4388 domain-containing protein [Candidatus Aminicenantes bacterium]NIN23389.1 DUF4388 domain-containing protein [Candidatus Aminicenantes bacterium]NIN47091.1 DUF4388 domain-containing protein [Candidatus Aminicenantes bacterium]NIN90015.1 DUF4388 domain-containing protein [Candidatus Aminicenantes bacterium]